MALKKEYWVIGILSIMVVAFVLIIVIATIATSELRTPPPAITGLIATDTSYDRHGQIDISWNPSDATDFLYYYIYASEEEITSVADLSPIVKIDDITNVSYQATKYRVPGVRLALFAFMNDTEYWFTVTAVDMDGKESMVTDSVSTTIEMMPPPPTIFIQKIYGGNEVPGYQSDPVTVPIGTTLAWSDLDVTSQIQYPHTVTSDTGLFHEDLWGYRDVFTYTFTEAGVFHYHCERHDGETATVIVE